MAKATVLLGNTNLNLPPTVQLAKICELIADSVAYCGMWMEVIKLTAAGRLDPITLAGGSDRKLPSTQRLLPPLIVTIWCLMESLRRGWIFARWRIPIRAVEYFIANRQHRITAARDGDGGARQRRLLVDSPARQSVTSRVIRNPPSPSRDRNHIPPRRQSSNFEWILLFLTVAQF